MRVSVLQAQNNTNYSKTSSETVLPRPPPSREHSRFQIRIWFLYETIFRVWDYRRNYSISFSVDAAKPFECVKSFFPKRLNQFLTLSLVGNGNEDRCHLPT